MAYDGKHHRTDRVLARPDGTALHYASAGSGPLVLLAHGYLLDHHLYDGLLTTLAERGWHAVAFDQRGHGRSGGDAGAFGPDDMADDYAALIEHLGDGPVRLVAHSMGAFLAVLACLRHRALFEARVERLILLGGNAGSVAEGSLPNRLQTPLLRTGILPHLWRIGPIGRALVAPLFGDDADPSQVEWTRQTLLRSDPARSLPVLEAMLGWDLYPRLEEIPVATRVLCGTRDQTCPPWHSERLARDIPNAQLTRLPGRGHMLPLEAPAAVLEALLEGTHVVAPDVTNVTEGAGVTGPGGVST